MAPRDRRTIRYDQFVTSERSSSKRAWLRLMAWVGLPLVALGAAAAAYVGLHSAKPVLATAPPPALSRAGKPIAGEAYRWAPVAIGGGGFISGLAMDPAAKTFVVRADVYGAYVWNRAQDRWDQLATAAALPAADRTQDGVATGGYEVAVAPSRPERIYMAIRGVVYRSDDRGASFTLASAGNPFPLSWNANNEYRLHGPYMAVDPTNPDLVLLGTPSNGLWRSADAGQSWTRVASVPGNAEVSQIRDASAPGTLVWFERAAGGKPTGRVFAFAAKKGMYVSGDRGASFTVLPSTGGAFPKTLKRAAFDRHGTFFAADIEGKAIWSYAQGRWRNVTQEAGLRAGDYAAVATDPRSDRVIVLDQAGGGYVSPDAGKSWSTLSHSSQVGRSDPPWLKVSDSSYFSTGDVMFDPVTANRLWIAAGTGVYYADLAPGETHLSWTSQSRGIEELVANDVIQAPGHAPLFAAWDFGIHIKTDLGAFSTSFAPDRGFIAVQQLDWTPADPAFVVTNASDTRSCCSEDGNAVMAGFSEDAGARWRKFATLPTPPGTKPEDPWRMSYGTIAVSSGSADNIVWAPAFNRTPYYTLDRGRSWQPVVLPGASGDTPGSFTYSWYQRKTLAADKTTPGVFYLYHSGEAPNQSLVGLWRTRDGGANWEQVFSSEIAPNSDYAAKLRSVPGHAGHLFFTSAFAHAGDTGLRRSTDGGASWTLVPEVTRVDDIAFGKAAPGAGYPAIYISGRVGGAYGVWRSVDAAATWHRLVDFPVGRLDKVTVVGADPDVFGRVYLGYVGSGWIWGEPAPCGLAPAITAKSPRNRWERNLPGYPRELIIACMFQKDCKSARLSARTEKCGRAGIVKAGLVVAQFGRAHIERLVVLYRAGGVPASSRIL